MNAPILQTSDRTPEVTAFWQHALWSGAHAKDPDSWHAQRRRVVTASNMAALLGVDPYRDPIDLYADMAASVAPPEFQVGFDSPMHWGHVLEEPIAREAGRHFDWEVKMSGYLLLSRACPLIGATLDAEIREASAVEWIPYEGKTVSSWMFKDWDEDAGEPPARILVQAQTQLLVTGAEKCVVFALVGGNRPCRIDILPRRDLHAVMIEAAEELMERIAALDPPPPTWRSKGALDRIYAEESGARVQLDAAALEWTREIRAIAEQRKVIEQREAEIKNLLRATIREATYAELPEAVDGKRVWQWKADKNGRRGLLLVKGEQAKPKRRCA